MVIEIGNQVSSSNAYNGTDDFGDKNRDNGVITGEGQFMTTTIIYKNIKRNSNDNNNNRYSKQQTLHK